MNLFHAHNAFGFNRYMVECESTDTQTKFFHIVVLIDTWWNVNEEKISVKEPVLAVLIDTWWNVNLINLLFSLRENLVLIDTWWNVNTYDEMMLGGDI